MFDNRIGVARRAAGAVMLAGVLIGVPAAGVVALAHAGPSVTPKTDIYSGGSSPGATCYDEGLGVGHIC